MTIHKVYQFGGLDLRNSNITQRDTSASNLRNVELSSKRTLRKRKGFEALLTPSETPLQFFENVRGGDDLYVFDDGVKKITGGVESAVNFGGNAWTTLTEPLCIDEYSGVNYLSDPSGTNEIFKYDGYNVYRAGVPKVEVNSITPAGAGAYYFRLAFFFRDAQLNIHWGDYYQTDTTYGATTVFNIDSLKSTQFYYNYGVVNGNQTIDSGNLDLTVDAGHRYQAGDAVIALTGTPFVPKVLVVESVTATEVTFTSASVGGDSFFFTNNYDAELLTRWTVGIFRSSNADYGYEIYSTDVVFNSTTTTNITPISFTAGTGTPMEEVYGDPSIVKGLPPKCKYLTVHNNQLILMNKVREDESTDLNSVEEDSIFWNDLGIGSSVETFPPLNVETVGKTNEGGIVGGFSNTESLAILKGRQVYNLTGTLQNRAFRIRNSLSTGVGCVSNQSIAEYRGGCIFVSSKGIYWVAGGEPIEISDSIEPIFSDGALGLNDLLLQNSKTVVDVANEKIYIYIPASTEDNKIVLVYDYYFKEWFLHGNIKADSGLLVNSSGQLLHCDGTTIFNRTEDYSDNGSAIEAYYQTAWLNFGTPALRKKFINFVAIDTSGEDHTLTLKSRLDWDDVTNSTNTTVSMVGKVVEDKKLNFAQVYALCLIIGNETSDEGLFLDGYELEWEATQNKPKGAQ